MDEEISGYERARRLTARFAEGGGLPADRDRAIGLFEEAIAAGVLSVEDEHIARAAIGALLLMRALPGFPLGADPTGASFVMWLTVMTTGPGLVQPDAREDIDRAAAHLRHVAERAPEGSEMRAEVQGPLALAEMLRLVPHLLTGAAPAEPDASAEFARTLDGAVREMPASPERDLLGGVSALLRGGAFDPGGVDPTSAGAVVDALRTMLDALPDNHALRPSLLAEQATLLGQVGQATGSPAALAGAPALVEQALAGLDAGDPRRDALVRKLSGLSVAATAYLPGGGDVDRLVAMAEDLLDGDLRAADPVARGKDHFLRAMVLTLRGRRDGSAADLRSAVDDLRRALELVPAEDPIAPAISATLGALLHDRGLAAGVLEDAEAARFHLEQARMVLEAHGAAGTGPDAYPIGALLALHRAGGAIQRRDPALLDTAVAELRAAIAAFPPGYPWRSRFDGVLGLTLLARGTVNGRLDDLRAGLAHMEQAAVTMAVEASGRPALESLGGIAVLLRGLLDNDENAIAAGADRLSGALSAEGLGHTERVAVLSAGGIAHQIRYERDGDPAELDAAVSRLESARDLLVDGDANPQASHLLHRLAGAYRQRADTLAGPARDLELDRAVRTGLDGLRAFGGTALLQSSPAHGLAVVRGATADAQRVAAWCLDAGRPDLAVAAVELGRGLVLHAAAASAQVGAMLRDAGREELADEWDASGAASGAASGSASGSGAAPAWPAEVAALATGFLHAGAPTDLRRRVLEALRGTPAAQRLLAAPDPAGIAGALRRLDTDALVYLLPGGPDADGRLLLVDRDGGVADLPAPELVETGPVTAFLAARDLWLGSVRAGRTHRDLAPEGPGGWPDALADLCAWAWPAAMEPLLARTTRTDGRPPRLVLVPGGALGCVPWHAARRPDGRYALENAVVSYAASARQVLDVSARPTGPAGAALLVADPTGSLPGATTEIDALRAGIYPDATVLGAAADPAGAGTPDEVLAHLPGARNPGAGLIHLACHANAGTAPDRSYLRLTERLPVTAVLRHAHRRPAGGALVVVLSACTSDLTAGAYDEALTLATAFHAAGATTVVGSLWAVPDATTPHLMYLFHHYLTGRGLPAADALNAAQRWMLDPDRDPVPGMPSGLAVTGRAAGLAEIDAWAAFTHHGR